MTKHVEVNATRHGWRASKNATPIEQLQISKEDQREEEAKECSGDTQKR